MSGSDLVERVDSPTEARNPRTLDIDTVPTLRVLRLLNDEDALVAGAVRDALPPLAVAVDAAAARFEAGGTIHYFGAGTSGGIGILDAAELPPTFAVEPSRVVAHYAGGAGATRRAVEAAEDDRDAGRAEAAGVTSADVVVGLSASGRAPWVLGALEAARAVGAYTVGVSSRPGARIAELVDVHVCADTGPEAIAGSTRLKAGSAQKMILNGFSTALMIRLGKTYSNLMIDVASTNSKLRGRARTILEAATGAPDEDCASALEAAGGDLRVALVSLLTGVDHATATAALEDADSRVRGAVAALGGDAASTGPETRPADPSTPSPLRRGNAARMVVDGSTGTTTEAPMG